MRYIPDQKLLQVLLVNSCLFKIPAKTPTGMREVKAPALLRQAVNRWRQGCQPYAPAALYPQVSLFLKIPGTHFC
jgi:hypothetical protein